MSLSAWLARRRRSVRRLSLSSFSHYYAITAGAGATALPAVLGSLAGGALAHLEISWVPTRDLFLLHPLQYLGGLTRLSFSHCSLGSLPPGLSGLSRLAELRWCNEDLSGSRATAFRPLRHLAGTLTALQLPSLSLRRLPPELGELSRLEALELQNNWELGLGDDMACRPLQDLSAVTRLDLAGLRAPPLQLASLGAGLRELCIDRCLYQASQDEQEAASFVLQHLTALTRLSARSCHLARIPPGLRSLQELELSGLEPWFDWESASHLGALRKLTLKTCALPALPAAWSSLGALETLDLTGCYGFLHTGGEGGLSPLHYMTSLRRIDLTACGLGSVEATAFLARAVPALLLRGLCMEYNGVELWLGSGPAPSPAAAAAENSGPTGPGASIGPAPAAPEFGYMDESDGVSLEWSDGLTLDTASGGGEGGPSDGEEVEYPGSGGSSAEEEEGAEGASEEEEGPEQPEEEQWEAGSVDMGSSEDDEGFPDW